jgi:hypothetical protein
MRDWRNIALAQGLGEAPRDLDRITSPLELLEQTLRPLMAELTPDVEPDCQLRLPEGAE